jgi:hypothetical protein
MASASAYPVLLESLHQLRRQWRQQKVLEGILVAAAGTAAVLIVTVAVDNLLHPGTLGRALLAMCLWGTLLAALMGLVIRRVLEDRRDDFFAALVEQKHPELHNQLINALQLGRGSANGFSPVLIQAIVSDAARATADLEMTDSVDGKPLKRAALIAAVAAVVVAGYALAFTPRFANGIARVLLPAADIPAYTATRIVEESVKPGSTRVPEGAVVTIEARATGEVPAVATLYRQVGDRWQSSVMQPDKSASDLFRITLPQANESFRYYIAAGDGRSREHRVEVVKRPQIVRLSVTYTLPAYTSQPPRRVTEFDGEISQLAGTRVELELKASKPLHEAKLVTREGEVIVLDKAGDEQSARGVFFLWGRDAKASGDIAGRLLHAPTTYQIKLLDSDGYDNADPLWRTITLVRDQAPSVAITTPGRDVQVKPDAAVPLTVEARDDYGLGEIRILYRVNDEPTPRELAHFPHDGPPQLQSSDVFEWKLGSGQSFKPGDTVQYWATAVDRNTITGPGKVESRRFTLFITTPEQAVAKLDQHMDDFAQVLEELVRMQRENRAQTTSGVAFETLVQRQNTIRTRTRQLARAMEKDAVPVATMVKSLDDLFAGLMAEAVKLLESGRDASDAAKAASLRGDALPVQDKIIAELEALLARLQRNEQARQALRKMEKTDKPAHNQVAKTLAQMLKDLDRMLKDQTELANKFEKLPKKPVDELKGDKLNAMKELEEFRQRMEKWAKGTVNELTKLPQGFVDDFQLRPDVNKIFEEVEKAAQRSKAEKMEVSLEDLGAGLATKMKEDLEMWLADSPDNIKWVHEEPLDKKPMKIPEMPLPKALEDLIGDLLQKAEEFDEEADDVTSAWGDNLDQAGWGVSDGPISNFSAKGKTGNDLPNNQEVTGRSGDGRRGKSTGQMVGDTAKALQGRKTPARVGAERYEPGQLKQEGQDDPNGATGGGKKAGSGRKGLQGGTPPDLVKDMKRLSEKQAGVREKAEQVARKLESVGITSRRLTESIELMKSVEKDLRDLRYDDSARKRRTALTTLRGSVVELDQSTAAQLSRARDLPPHLRTELLQAAEEGYPPGYESLLKSYFKALSAAEK